MATIQNAQQIGSAFRKIFHLLNSSPDSGEASLLSEILGAPAQIGGELIYTDLGIIQDLQRVDYQTGDDLRQTATNYGITVSEGQYAWVDETFYTAIAPIVDTTIAVNFRVSNITDDLEAPVEFATTTSATMLVSQLTNYYVPDRGRYEITVRIQALDPGTQANIGKNKITQLLDSLAGWGCVNYGDATGGLGEDSDETIRNNIKLAILGKIITTQTGTQKFALANQWGYDFGFADAQVINVNNSLSERPTGTDLFVISSSTLTDSTFTFSYTGGIVDVPLRYRPALAVASITAAGFGTLIPGVHYQFHRDTASSNRFSNRSLDKVTILGGFPAPTTLTFTYTYADKVSSCQDTLALPLFNANADNVLVKKAIEHLLYMQARVSFFANADVGLEKSNLQQAFSTYLSTFKLGAPLQGSDMEIVLQTGYGDYPITSVDQVVLVNWWTVDELGVTHTPTLEEIALSAKEYAREGSLTFV